MVKILLVEDNPLTAKGLEYLLEREQYQVEVARDAKSAREKYASDCDLILLDVGLPDGDGFRLAKEFGAADGTVAGAATRTRAGRAPSAAVIFLTAKDREEDIVRGLKLGADDYIVKPFHNRELLLRIQNILRRKESRPPEKQQYGDFTFDPLAHEIVHGEEKIILTALESRILRRLLETPGQIITRVQILDEIWSASGSIVNDNTVSVYIKRLREKLGAGTIVTVKNLGYRLVLTEPEKPRRVKAARQNKHER